MLSQNRDRFGDSRSWQRIDKPIKIARMKHATVGRKRNDDYRSVDRANGAHENSTHDSPLEIMWKKMEAKRRRPENLLDDLYEAGTFKDGAFSPKFDKDKTEFNFKEKPRKIEQMKPPIGFVNKDQTIFDF